MLFCVILNAVCINIDIFRNWFTCLMLCYFFRLLRCDPTHNDFSRRVINSSQLYLTTHNTHNRKTSMPPTGFKPTISAGERPQTARPPGADCQFRLDNISSLHAVREPEAVQTEMTWGQITRVTFFMRCIQYIGPQRGYEYWQEITRVHPDVKRPVTSYQDTAMRRITTFRSTTDRIYDGGPIIL